MATCRLGHRHHLTRHLDEPVAVLTHWLAFYLWCKHYAHVQRNLVFIEHWDISCDHNHNTQWGWLSNRPRFKSQGQNVPFILFQFEEWRKFIRVHKIVFFNSSLIKTEPGRSSPEIKIMNNTWPTPWCMKYRCKGYVLKLLI